jgi:hypothetical protein
VLDVTIGHTRQPRQVGHNGGVKVSKIGTPQRGALLKYVRRNFKCEPRKRAPNIGN